LCRGPGERSQARVPALSCPRDASQQHTAMVSPTIDEANLVSNTSFASAPDVCTDKGFVRRFRPDEVTEPHVPRSSSFPRGRRAPPPPSTTIPIERRRSELRRSLGRKELDSMKYQGGERTVSRAGSMKSGKSSSPFVLPRDARQQCSVTVSAAIDEASLVSNTSFALAQDACSDDAVPEMGTATGQGRFRIDEVTESIGHVECEEGAETLSAACVVHSDKLDVFNEYAAAIPTDNCEGQAVPAPASSNAPLSSNYRSAALALHRAFYASQSNAGRGLDSGKEAIACTARKIDELDAERKQLNERYNSRHGFPPPLNGESTSPAPEGSARLDHFRLLWLQSRTAEASTCHKEPVVCGVVA